MRAVFALVLVVGMALAGVAVYMAQNYIGQSQAALAKANEFRERTGKRDLLGHAGIGAPPDSDIGGIEVLEGAVAVEHHHQCI